MGKTRTFDGVTADIFECVKQASKKEHDTDYTSGTKGTATTSVPVLGKIVMEFDFNAGDKTITYTIAEKPFMVPENKIWSGVKETIDRCRG